MTMDSINKYRMKEPAPVTLSEIVAAKIRDLSRPAGLPIVLRLQ